MIILTSASFGTSKAGLATVGYRPKDVNGDFLAARQTAGVVEIGSGLYEASYDAPDGTAAIQWDTGEGSPRYYIDDLIFALSAQASGIESSDELVPSKIVTFTHAPEGVLTDVTSVVFRDPDNTYGVRRVDTEEVLAEPDVGDALPKISTGTYQYTIENLTAGLEYEYWVEWVYLGVTTRINRQFVAGAVSTYAGRYTTRLQIQTFLDSRNYTVHTDSDRDEDSDLAAAVQGHKAAEARVDLHTGGPYTFTDDTVGEVAAETFNRWAYVLAGYQYAAKRGFSGNQENEFIRNRDEVLLEMQQFRDGLLPLPGAIPPSGETSTDLDQLLALSPARGKLNCCIPLTTDACCEN